MVMFQAEQRKPSGRDDRPPPEMMDKEKGASNVLPPKVAGSDRDSSAYLPIEDDEMPA
jgi:hypothetical protein